VREVNCLHAAEEVQRAIAQVLTHPEYPTFMSESGCIVKNPVWRYVTTKERKQTIAVFRPEGPTVPKVMRVDMLLIRRNDERHDGELLTYYSPGWKTHLIHFRPWKPDDNPAERGKMNAQKFASKWGVPAESIRVTPTGRFAVSAKINEEYKDLYLYIFEFCSVCCSQWSEELRQIHRDGYTQITPVERRGKWRNLRQMRTDPTTARVNGDAVRAVHDLFDVNLCSLPYSFPDSA
jgi:hypothetical protein